MFLQIHNTGGRRRSRTRRERESLRYGTAMSDQELTGGGRRSRGGYAADAGGGLGREIASTCDVLTARAGVPMLSGARAGWNVETRFDSLAAWNAGDAGSHGVEKRVEASGAFKQCACAMARPNATISASPNAKPAHLRTMARSYTRMHERAIEGPRWGATSRRRAGEASCSGACGREVAQEFFAPAADGFGRLARCLHAGRGPDRRSTSWDSPARAADSPAGTRR